MATGKHFLILMIVVLFSCSKDSDPGNGAEPKCLVTTFHDTYRVEPVTVERNSDGNAVKLFADTYEYSDELTYDANKRLIKVRRSTPPTLVHIIDLGYDGSGRIQSATMYQEGYPNATTQTNFTYDAKGKLVKKEYLQGGSFAYFSRYEYSGDNISTIYYKSQLDEEESIGVDDLSFDTHQRFFSDDVSLRTYFIYVMGVEPSVNNMLGCKITKSSPYGTNLNPGNVTFTIHYDDRGKVIDYTPSSGIYTDQEYYFYNVGYDCK